MPHFTTAGATADRDAEANRSRGGRTAAAAVGGALAVAGLRRRSLGGAALALAGGWLLYRGLGDREGRTAGRESGDEARAAGHAESEAATSADPTAVERSVTVGESADDLYRFWRDPDLLDQVAGPFAEVTAAGDDRHRWSVSAPLGRRVEWETELVEDRPGERLRWRSTEGAPVYSEGSVEFRPAPADRGTEVTLRLRIDPPGGRVGRTAMGLLGVVPGALANQLLDRFKSLAETGEIPTLERNPSARGRGDLV